MRRLTNSRFMSVICAVAMVVLPLAVATDGAAAGRPLRKHHHHHRLAPRFSDSRAAGWVLPAAAPPGRGGDVCPGNARSFDCRIWPPPFDEDPDRKASGSDAGG